MSCKVWDRSQTPRILMSGSREPGSGRRNVYFWQQCPVPPCQGVRDPGSRDRPAHHSLLHKVEAEMCALPAGSLGPLDTPHPPDLPRNSVIVSLFAELGVGWPGPFRHLSPSLGTRDHLQSRSEDTGSSRTTSSLDFRASGLTPSTCKGESEGTQGRLKSQVRSQKRGLNVQESQVRIPVLEQARETAAKTLCSL